MINAGDKYRMLLKYLDHLSSLPDDLESLCLQQIRQGRLLYENPERYLTKGHKRIPNILYQSWSLPDAVESWIRSNIDDCYTNIGLQVQNARARQGDHLPHTDWDERRSVINWVIDTGGDRVITTFYQERGQALRREPETRVDDAGRLITIESHEIAGHRWVWLDTSVIHGVTGISDCRVSISIGFDKHDLPQLAST